MKNHLPLLLGALLFSCKMQDQPDVSVYQPVFSKLEAAIAYEIDQKQLNAISIVLVDDQQIIYSEGFGFADPGRQIPASAATVYRVGSVSKLFTDMAIMQRVEAGDLDLDVPIQTYLPDFRPDNPFSTPITLRQLMSHRSGLLREPEIGNYFDADGTSLEATVQSIVPSRLIYEPESATKYSNAGIAVVGYVLEKRYQQPYVEYMQEKVLDPIGMTNSAFAPTEKIEAHLATATMWSYDGRRFPAPTFQLGMSPAGSLYAPVGDLGIFLTALFRGGAVVEEATLRQMWSPQFGGQPTAGYGLGFSLGEFEGHQKVGHGGAIYGFSTQLSAVPALKIGAACASSVDITNAITTRLTNYALELMNAQKGGKPLPDYQMTTPVDPQRASALVGAYSGSEGTFEIVQRNEELILRTDRVDIPLRKLGEEIISDGRLDFGHFRLKSAPEGVLVNGQPFGKIELTQTTDFPAAWTGLIGEYGPDYNILYIYEDQGDLWALIEWSEKDRLTPVSGEVFAFPERGGMYPGENLIFTRNAQGEATQIAIENGPVFRRRDVGATTTETFRIEPVKPIDQLRREALEATPPKEAGDFRQADLVDLQTLDPSIRYDIRYASTNNFMSNTFYTLAKAYMQRSAAEAVVRAHQKLKSRGYGLMIHDAYRPWYVTKMFWDATPADLKIFVANPQNGSRHNRGCAVDLTLFDLKTGQPVEMVAGYDEMTDRSFPDYYGGTTQQRWHRALLRLAMEAEGFRVYDFEWWHFDYKDWREYTIGNVGFEEL